MICIAKNSKTKINNDTIDVLDLIMPEQHEHYTITALEPQVLVTIFIFFSEYSKNVEKK
jgi:hypothetical protein